MLDYLLYGLNILLTLILLVFSIKLYLNTLGSKLYSNVVLSLIVLSFVSLIFILRNFINHDVLNNYYLILALKSLYAFLLYKTFIITYNLIARDNNSGFVLILLLLNILLYYIKVNNEIVFNSILQLIFTYQIPYLLVFVLTIVGYLSNKFLSKTYEFNYLPLILGAIVLIEISISLDVVNYLVLNAFYILLNIGYFYIYYKDYKKSFYY